MPPTLMIGVVRNVSMSARSLVADQPSMPKYAASKSQHEPQMPCRMKVSRGPAAQSKSRSSLLTATGPPTSGTLLPPTRSQMIASARMVQQRQSQQEP
jgi:hypothetical protein